ncbi:MAG: hypothetical protein ACK58T_43830, partial [Phycisphaerae bacterium]
FSRKLHAFRPAVMIFQVLSSDFHSRIGCIAVRRPCECMVSVRLSGMMTTIEARLSLQSPKRIQPPYRKQNRVSLRGSI